MSQGNGCRSLCMVDDAADAGVVGAIGDDVVRVAVRVRREHAVAVLVLYSGVG